MAGKGPTTKQKERSEEADAAVGDMFATSFDDIETPEVEENEAEENEAVEEESEKKSDNDEEQSANAPKKGPPSKGPSEGPPSKGPPSKGPPSKGPSEGPPSKGPPSKGPSEEPPSKGPPSKEPSEEPPSKGPPSKGPPSKGPPSESEDKSSEPEDETTGEEPTEEAESEDDEFSEELLASVTHSAGSEMREVEEEAKAEEKEATTESDKEEPPEEPKEVKKPDDSERVKQLESEVERLRGGLAGAAEVIEELENPPLPPIVGEDFVIPSHLVSDFVRFGRQIHRDGLVMATQGAISILDPDQPGLMHSTSKGCALGQVSELDIVSGRLGQAGPPAAPDEWRVMEILIAATSLHNNGPAACIHVQPPYATTVALEKDRIVLQPIDLYGKENLGKAVIVDPDMDDMDEYLRQVAEALQQGNMKCVVVRGVGVFAVGRNFNEAWYWAATLEHSMQVLLLARQAGMKT